MQKRHMGIMRYILPLVAAMVMVSCVGDDRTVNIDDPFIDNGGLKGIYLGVWSIEGQPDIPSELTVYDTPGSASRRCLWRLCLGQCFPDTT